MVSHSKTTKYSLIITERLGDMRKHFLDTNALLDYHDRLDELDNFILSSISLTEIENIKTSATKDEEIKHKARAVSRYLANNDDAYDVVVVHSNHYNILDTMDLPLTNDNLIVACAYSVAQAGKVLFISRDLNCRIVAQRIFGLDVGELYTKETTPYTGWEEITMDDQAMSEFYQGMENKWGLLTNQYLVIKNTNGEIVDKLKWDGNEFTAIRSKQLKSMAFGNIKARDVYQEMAIDSLLYNDFTILTGKVGSAKTLLSLAYIMQALQNNKIDSVVVAHNPIPLAHGKSLGFYPGTRTQKLLETSIGGILSSKLGDPMIVETLINQGKLTLVPMCDIRGFEIGANSCVFVSEAQNMDVYLTKTLIQRCKEGCKIILEGDSRQTDLVRYSGTNGLYRAIEVFKGHEKFSCVELQTIYRSPLSEIAEQM